MFSMQFCCVFLYFHEKKDNTVRNTMRTLPFKERAKKWGFFIKSFDNKLSHLALAGDFWGQDIMKFYTVRHEV